MPEQPANLPGASQPSIQANDEQARAVIAQLDQLYTDARQLSRTFLPNQVDGPLRWMKLGGVVDGAARLLRSETVAVEARGPLAEIKESIVDLRTQLDSMLSKPLSRDNIGTIHDALWQPENPLQLTTTPMPDDIRAARIDRWMTLPQTFQPLPDLSSSITRTDSKGSRFGEKEAYFRAVGPNDQPVMLYRGWNGTEEQAKLLGFLDELQIGNPQIRAAMPAIYGTYTENGQLYLVMEQLQNRQELYGANALSSEEFLSVFGDSLTDNFRSRVARHGLNLGRDSLEYDYLFRDPDGRIRLGIPFRANSFVDNAREMYRMDIPGALSNRLQSQPLQGNMSGAGREDMLHSAPEQSNEFKPGRAGAVSRPQLSDDALAWLNAKPSDSRPLSAFREGAPRYRGPYDALPQESYPSSEILSIDEFDARVRAGGPVTPPRPQQSPRMEPRQQQVASQQQQTRDAVIDRPGTALDSKIEARVKTAMEHRAPVEERLFEMRFGRRPSTEELADAMQWRDRELKVKLHDQPVSTINKLINEFTQETRVSAAMLDTIDIEAQLAGRRSQPFDAGRAFMKLGQDLADQDYPQRYLNQYQEGLRHKLNVPTLQDIPIEKLFPGDGIDRTIRSALNDAHIRTAAELVQANDAAMSRMDRSMMVRIDAQLDELGATRRMSLSAVGEWMPRMMSIDMSDRLLPNERPAVTPRSQWPHQGLSPDNTVTFVSEGNMSGAGRLDAPEPRPLSAPEPMEDPFRPGQMRRMTPAEMRAAMKLTSGHPHRPPPQVIQPQTQYAFDPAEDPAVKLSPGSRGMNSPIGTPAPTTMEQQRTQWTIQQQQQQQQQQRIATAEKPNLDISTDPTTGNHIISVEENGQRRIVAINDMPNMTPRLSKGFSSTAAADGYDFTTLRFSAVVDDNGNVIPNQPLRVAPTEAAPVRTIEANQYLHATNADTPTARELHILNELEWRPTANGLYSAPMPGDGRARIDLIRGLHKLDVGFNALDGELQILAGHVPTLEAHGINITRSAAVMQQPAALFQSGEIGAAQATSLFRPSASMPIAPVTLYADAALAYQAGQVMPDLVNPIRISGASHMPTVPIKGVGFVGGSVMVSGLIGVGIGFFDRKMGSDFINHSLGADALARGDTTAALAQLGGTFAMLPTEEMLIQYRALNKGGERTQVELDDLIDRVPFEGGKLTDLHLRNIQTLRNLNAEGHTAALIDRHSGEILADSPALRIPSSEIGRAQWTPVNVVDQLSTEAKYYYGKGGTIYTLEREISGADFVHTQRTLDTLDSIKTKAGEQVVTSMFDGLDGSTPDKKTSDAELTAFIERYRLDKTFLDPNHDGLASGEEVAFAAAQVYAAMHANNNDIKAAVAAMRGVHAVLEKDILPNMQKLGWDTKTPEQLATLMHQAGVTAATEGLDANKNFEIDAPELHAQLIKLLGKSGQER